MVVPRHSVSRRLLSEQDQEAVVQVERPEIKTADWVNVRLKGKTMPDPNVFFVGRKLTRRTSNKIPGLPQLDEADKLAGNFQIIRWNPTMISLRLIKTDKLIGKKFRCDPDELERLQGPFIWEFED